MSDSNPHGVKVGQIWESCDKRYPNNSIKVAVVYEDRGYATVIIQKNSRFRQIKLSRFRERSNGYRLIKDVTSSG